MVSQEPNTTVVKASSATHTMSYSTRDWKVLANARVDGGIEWLSLMGFMTEEMVIHKRVDVINHSRRLEGILREQADLLAADYELTPLASRKALLTPGALPVVGEVLYDIETQP